jgi:bifunctional NMN adenylyltransferase/nudix hydrolase
MFDALVTIFRGQPITLAHKSVIVAGLAKAETVVVCLGSSYEAPDPFKNPFSFEQRKEMLEAIFPNEPRLFVEPILDYRNDDPSWINGVKRAVKYSGAFKNNYDTAKIGIIGHKKDSSSYYIDIFPDWEPVDVPLVISPTGEPANATAVRNSLFNNLMFEDVHSIWDDPDYVDPAVTKLLIEWFYGSGLEDKTDWLVDEYEFNMNYQKSMEVGKPIKHALNHITADALVTWSGHVLLVERKYHPGKGLWALPGGFKKPEERWLDAAIRELREETKLKIPEPVLRGSIKGSHVEDEPKRSNRGTIITQVWHFDLKSGGKAPAVKASDDAKRAKWVPIEQIKRCNMFEDHYHLIRHFISGIQ